MPFNDTLPPQGTKPWFIPFTVAWEALKTFVNALESSIGTKADAAHTHTQSQVTGLVSALQAKADLVGGLIPNSQLPPLAIQRPFPVASQAAMLALTAEIGDIAIRSDVSKTFILSTNSPSTLADWLEMSGSGAGGVISVNGKTGVVAIAIGDLAGLQDALDSKVTGFAAPGADRILFWDQSAGGYRALTVGTGLNITGTTLTATGGGLASVEFDGTNWPARPATSGVVLAISTKWPTAPRPTWMVSGQYDGDIWLPDPDSTVV